MEPFLDEEPASDAVEGDPAAKDLRREGVELAFVAALQHLPGTQRTVLILREVLEFPAAEVARILDTSTASVNSALQRARKAVDERVQGTSQQSELDALGAKGQRELIDAFVQAWERADITALLDLLTDDARFTMPPLPAWFDGRDRSAGSSRSECSPLRGDWRLCAPTDSWASPATSSSPATTGTASARSMC